jgi:cephalosporin hydroxylase
MFEAITRRIPFEVKFAWRRRLRDLPVSTRFQFDTGTQRRALSDLESCRTVRDHIGFTQRHMGVGSVQKPEEIEAAIDYMNTETCRYICEIGTESGGPNFLLGHLLKPAEMVVGIDLFVRHKPHLRRFRRPGQELHYFDGSSRTDQMAERLRRVLQGRQLDVLFIDGDHHYHGAKADFLLYHSFVREGGFILFHDIVPDHAQRFGKASGGWSGGVPTLWKELKAFYPENREFIRDPDQDGMGIGVLRYAAAVNLPDEWIRRTEMLPAAALAA